VTQYIIERKRFDSET